MIENLDSWKIDFLSFAKRFCGSGNYKSNFTLFYYFYYFLKQIKHFEGLCFQFEEIDSAGIMQSDQSGKIEYCYNFFRSALHMLLRI